MTAIILNEKAIASCASWKFQFPPPTERIYMEFATYPSNIERYCTKIIPKVGFDSSSPVDIFWQPSKIEEIMDIFLATEAIRSQTDSQINLWLPYIPYGREDRRNSKEFFSLKCFSNLLNQQNYHKIYTLNPHSDVTPALINNLRVLPEEYLTHLLENRGPETYIVFPDLGAHKKYTNPEGYYWNHLKKFPYLTFTKQRNALNGELSSFKLWENVNLEDQKCLIIDDICDGGSTFIECAKILQERGCKDISLYVTHGIFSKGKEVLKPYFKNIYFSVDLTKGDQNDNI